MTTLQLILVLVAVAVVAAGVFVAVRRRSQTTTLDRPVTQPPAVEVAEPEVEGEPVAVEAPVIEPDVVEAPVRPSFFDRLGKARSNLSGLLGGVFGRGKVDEDTWEELEEAMIRADVGVATSLALISDVRADATEAGITESAELLDIVKTRMRATIADRDRSLRIDADTTNVWLFVGVNGVGKTTTIGKLGKRLTGEGRVVLMAAGDTFRAAAAEQLGTWAERAGCEFIRGDEGADPSSVVFDAVQSAASKNVEVVLADTAGRLHNKSNLMDELSKVRRVAEKDAGVVTETLLVIDATTGQNGLNQARTFAEAVDVTGVVLTKLDGSAKGGIVFAIEAELGLPVKLVGLGETADDLVDFDPDEFVDALFD